MSEKIGYYAIIPANVRYDQRLTANAKLLYGEITALTNEKGYCWASDRYFAELYNVSKTTIQNWLKSLTDNGYIKKELIYREGTQEILSRYIRILGYPTQENLSSPIQENLRDNNTLLNNTFNNTSDNKKTRKRKKRVYESTSIFFILAEELFKQICQNQEIKKPNLHQWADDIRKMIEIDKRTESQVRKMIQWSQKNSFWHANILSARKLREKFDTMAAQAKRDQASFNLSKKPIRQEPVPPWLEDPESYNAQIEAKIAEQWQKELERDGPYGS